MHTRVFIALSIDEASRKAIESLTTGIRKRMPGYRWVERQNLHVTLSFVGNVGNPQVPEICSLMADAVRTHVQFDLDFLGTGAFPDIKRPRVLWIGIGAGNSETRQLQQAIAEALEVLGYPPENRPYCPHLTIAHAHRSTRISSQLGAILGEFADWEGEGCTIRSVDVMASELTRRGPVYSLLASLPLRRPESQQPEKR